MGIGGINPDRIVAFLFHMRDVIKHGVDSGFSVRTDQLDRKFYSCGILRTLPGLDISRYGGNPIVFHFRNLATVDFDLPGRCQEGMIFRIFDLFAEGDPGLF